MTPLDPPMVHPGSPNARSTDPVESHQAADSISADASAASQAAVLAALESTLTPLADQEIARIVNRAERRFSDSRLRTARHELEEAGAVREVGTVKLAGSRSPSRTWEVVPAGERAATSHEDTVTDRDEPAAGGVGSEDWFLEEPKGWEL